MKKTTLFILAIFSVTHAAYAQCAPATTNIYTFDALGKTYEIIKEPLSWTQAAACAVSRGGTLAEINSQAEQDVIFTNISLAGINNNSTMAPDGGGGSYLWIGGNDAGTEGTWNWDGANIGAGTPFWQGNAAGAPVGGLYNNWGNEPDDFFGQDYLGFAITSWPQGVAGEWNDLMAANNLYYIIEKPTPLPITLISFNGIRHNGTVQLQWKTGNQSRFSHFEIEKSTKEAQGFNGIGKVDFSGKDNYQFTDKDITGGDVFYRLKMMDMDGKSSYSNTIHIQTNETMEPLTYVNPASGMLTINGLTGKGQIRIVDLAGKKLADKKIESQKISIDVSSLASGLYLFQYYDGHNTKTCKFYKK